MSFVLEDCLTPKWKNAFHQALALHTASFFFMAFINAWYYGIITYIYVCLFIVCLPFPLKALSVRAGALPWAPLSSRAPMPLSYFKIRERIETWCVAGRAKLLRANQEYRKGVQSRTHWWRGQTALWEAKATFQKGPPQAHLWLITIPNQGFAVYSAWRSGIRVSCEISVVNMGNNFSRYSRHVD